MRNASPFIGCGLVAFVVFLVSGVLGHTLTSCSFCMLLLVLLLMEIVYDYSDSS